MKTATRQGARALKGETCKANLTLSLKGYQKLFVTSVMAGKSASSIVEELIDLHLKSWAMPVNLASRASSRQATSSANHDGSVEAMASDLAA